MTKFSAERLATLDSPVFTGDVRVPTAPALDSDTTVANTAFIAAGGGGFTTGDAKITLKTVADVGWVMMNDGNIGNAGSGATTRANVDCLALFTLLYNNISDSAAPILTSTGGATTRATQGTAAAAWAALCRVSLTKQLGRSIAVAGTGAGLTARPLGAALGAETETPTVANMATHGHSDAGHRHTYATGTILVDYGSTYTGWAVIAPSYTVTIDWGYAAIQSSGGGVPLNILDPSAYWNVMIKL